MGTLKGLTLLPVFYPKGGKSVKKDLKAQGAFSTVVAVILIKKGKFLKWVSFLRTAIGSLPRNSHFLLHIIRQPLLGCRTETIRRREILMANMATVIIGVWGRCSVVTKAIDLAVVWATLWP